MGLSAASLQELDTPELLAAAWPVVHQLRPHLDCDALVAAWQRQAPEGYRAVGLFIDGQCLGFAGFRLQHMLAHGRFLYVDDLVTDAAQRGSGIGSRLLDWLKAEAVRLGCASLQLDSGTHRFAAHGFYFAHRLHVSSFHFTVDCTAGA
jgi:GNAT superfamily N-acetyltransferase